MAAAGFLAGLLALCIVPLRANDSSAAIAMGGLELIKNDQVRMVSEVLRIAPRLVEVNYVFENTGNTDITTLVAFPLPNLELGDIARPPPDFAFPRSANLVGFQVWIDGRELKPDVEVRSFVGSHEITTDLKRLGADPVDPALDDPRILDALRRLNLIDDGLGVPVAVWTTKVNFHWTQTFPAGRQIAVRHLYHPVHGFYYYRPQPDYPITRPSSNDQKLGGQWCFDQTFNAAEMRLLDRQYEAAAKDKGKSRSDGFDVFYENVQYVLKTGANWKGPIGHFELQIDKGGADLVSTCPIPGLRLQRASYGFNAVANNYTTLSDLDILFVSSHSLGEPDGSDPTVR